MSVDSGDALVGTGLRELGGHDLLDGQDDTILASDTDRGAAVLYSLDGIFDLEVAAVGGEDGVGEIVTRSYRRLWTGVSVSSRSGWGCLWDEAAVEGELAGGVGRDRRGAGAAAAAAAAAEAGAGAYHDEGKSRVPREGDDGDGAVLEGSCGGRGSRSRLEEMDYGGWDGWR